MVREPMDRRVILAVVAVVAVVAAGLGWVAGQQIRSPGEIAASAEPPEPSLITVPIEMRTLSQSVVVRGTITPSDETELIVASTEGESVITGLPRQTGDLIEEGDVLIEVAGRPIIALEGELPAFRNLIPGLEGPDVEQLEEALVRLGYDPGTVDESYTATTAAAVAALYRDRGYQAPSSDDGEAALDAAEDAVDAQEAVVDGAVDALEAAEGDVSDTERARLDLTVREAEVALEAAQAEADRANAEAAAAITDARRARDDAATAATTASNRLTEARNGTHPDTGAPATAEEVAALERENDEAAAALAAAERALADAIAAEPLIADQQTVAVQAAQLALDEARASRNERLNPPDVAELRDDVADARRSLAEAQEELAEAQGRVGAWIPEVEVEFFTTLPRQVASLVVEVGEEPTGVAMTISGAETIVDSGVAAADRALIEEGAEAMMEDAQLGLAIPAVVTFVADQAGGGDLSSDRYRMRLEPTEEVPEDAIGVNLRIEIPITSSGGDVLAVPLSALSAGPDGTARVEVELADGTTRFVEVATGLRAEGFVEIDPIDFELDEGDRVVVGRDVSLPGGGDSTDDDGDDSQDDRDEDGS